MPLVTFNVPLTLSNDRVTGLRDAVHEALVTTAEVPSDDRFHVVHRHDASGLSIDPGFLGVVRGPDAVIVEITFRMGRTQHQKQALYNEIARLALAKAGFRSEDVMVVLTENTSLDWSFGGGVAQYALAPVPV